MPKSTKKNIKTIRFHLLSAFPSMFESYLGESLFKRAIQSKIVDVKRYDIRDFTTDRHHKIDDRPFGGGPGMVLAVQPIANAIGTIKRAISKKKGKRTRTILFSTRGTTLNAQMAKRLSRYDNLILICGRYEGVDERVAEYIADEEVSLGEFVLSGGELPALVLMETVSRQIPGFLGKEESLEETNGSFPTYTRPEVFIAGNKKRWNVPEVLRSGNHKKILEWRKEHGTRKDPRESV